MAPEPIDQAVCPSLRVTPGQPPSLRVRLAAPGPYLTRTRTGPRPRTVPPHAAGSSAVTPRRSNIEGATALHSWALCCRLFDHAAPKQSEQSSRDHSDPARLSVRLSLVT